MKGDTGTNWKRATEEKGQMPEGLPAEIRGCLCIMYKFYMPLSAWRIKKPKGNGIKDGFVCRVCVYAVVFWFFFVGFVRLPAMLFLHIKIYT